MKVYLIAESSGQVAFKITTAQVHSSLDHFMRMKIQKAIDEGIRYCRIPQRRTKTGIINESGLSGKMWLTH